MTLSQPDRIQISGEMVDLPQKVITAQNTQVQLDAVRADLQDQDDSLKIFFDKYNDIAMAYQEERRWLDGTTYTNVTNTDLHNAAQKFVGNKFYPTDGSWVNFQPQKHASTEGLPTSESANDEIEILSEGSGNLLFLIDFIINGQVSGVADDTLLASYSPGAGTMMVTAGGQTPGNYILVEGGGFSGLFLVTASAGTTLTVTEVVPPNGTLPMTTSNVLENIPGFTNSERNTLTSALYQNVLTGLSNLIISKVLTWETALNNQLTELNSNLDTRSPQASEITAAIADINNAIAVIDFWQALPNTGTLLNDSKFTDNNLGDLETEANARLTFATTRATQITTALGSITQNPDGTFSGSGIYHFRFIQIDLRINLAGGPLTEYYEKNIADIALDNIVTNATNRLATFGTELRTEPLSVNPVGTNVITVASTSGFAVSNTIFVMADSETELTGTITAINGLNITLSFTVPITYTLAKRARLYKQL